jgi:phospholipid/cholesterol/gamma-HCH transport system substrate-binding protein
MTVVGRPAWRGMWNRSTTIGAITVAACVIIAVVLGYLYISPPGQRDVVFATTDAALIKAGNEVRASGVPIGTVKSVKLERDQVEVTARIDRSVFLGDQSTVAVRMLTVAGGFYVSIDSAGREPLGGRTIPSDRVSLPYSIGDLLRDAPDKITGIDQNQLATSLKTLTVGLERNPDSINTLAQGLNSLLGQLTSQRDLIGQAVDVTAQYADEFNKNRDFLFNMIRKASLSIVTLDETAVGFGEAYRGLAEMFGRVQPLLNLYWNHREDFGRAFAQLKSALDSMNISMPQLITQLQTSMDSMRKALDASGGPPAGAPVLATDLCFPTAVVKC